MDLVINVVVMGHREARGVLVAVSLLRLFEVGL
jgi:hypothetical protein